MIDKSNKKLSIRKQCNLLNVNRSRVYYKAASIYDRDIAMMNFIDEEFTAHPFTGVERMVSIFRQEKKVVVNHKRIRRLMRKMGLMAIYPKPRTTKSIIEHAKYPCLIRKLDITEPDHVWCSDITYIRMAGGFMYLVAIMDYFSRYVLSWSVSNSLDSLFCMDALDEALGMSKPRVFHSDQGSQYTCSDFIDELKDRKIKISMSGQGRCFDNILSERLWRTVKYEEVYLHEYSDGHELIRSLREYFEYYNYRRPHSSLDYKTPVQVYQTGRQSLRCATASPPLRKATELNETLQLTP
jgi:putative transposase